MTTEEMLDIFFGRLETTTREGANNQYFVTWADIDYLYGELKDELRQQEREQGSEKVLKPEKTRPCKDCPFTMGCSESAEKLYRPELRQEREQP